MGECLTKYLIGADGKSAYQRLFGKPIREDIYGIGEQVMFRKRKSAVRDLDSRWMPGTWLGKNWGAQSHIVWDGERALEVFAVQKRPKEERWSLDVIQGITATPWNWSPETHEQATQPQIIPGTEPVENPVDQDENYTGAPHPMHIGKADLTQKWCTKVLSFYTLYINIILL